MALWKHGDFVRSVIGGPVMVVKGFTSQQQNVPQLVICQWFTPDLRLQEGNLVGDQLVRATPPLQSDQQS
jgi:uncharacterized protein YodC (DUF2158 family)